MGVSGRERGKWKVMTICESIKKRYIRLSKGQRKVAQYVIDNPNVVATQVASEIGRLAGVSESTVIRFCYAMNLSGFSELQEKMKHYILEKDGVIPVLPKMNANAAKRQNVQLDDVLSNNMKELLTVLQQMNVQQYNEIVTTLQDAQDIYIVGLNEALPVAFASYYELKQLRNNVHMMQNDAKKIASDILQMDNTSAVLIINVGNQCEELMEIAELIKRKNAKIITITNNSYSKLKKISTNYFDLNRQGQLEDGNVVIYALLRAIVKCLSAQLEVINSFKVSEQVNKSVNKLLIEVS